MMMTLTRMGVGEGKGAGEGEGVGEGKGCGRGCGRGGDYWSWKRVCKRSQESQVR